MVKFNINSNVTCDNVIIVNDVQFNLSDIDTEKIYSIIKGMGYTPSPVSIPTTPVSTDTPTPEVISQNGIKTTYQHSKDFKCKYITADKEGKNLKTKADSGKEYFMVRSNAFTRGQKACVKQAIMKAPGVKAFPATFVNQNGKEVHYTAYGFNTLKEAKTACEWLQTNHDTFSIQLLNNIQ